MKKNKILMSLVGLTIIVIAFVFLKPNDTVAVNNQELEKETEVIEETEDSLEVEIFVDDIVNEENGLELNVEDIKDEKVVDDKVEDEVVNNESVVTTNMTEQVENKKSEPPTSPENTMTKEEIEKDHEVPSDAEYTDKNVKPEPQEIPPVEPTKPIENKPPEPEVGSTNEEGKVFVPGFGYVEPAGESIYEESTGDGDWNKQIGH